MVPGITMILYWKMLKLFNKGEKHSMNKIGNNSVNLLSKFGKVLFGTRAAGLYLLLFAIVIGVATFIENDFGTSSAQKVVFKTKWFELLLFLFGGTVAYNIWHFKMLQRRWWSLFLFHVSILVILLGAGVTRYFGYEGMMHIRENETADSFLSAETFLNFEVIDGNQRYQFDEPVLFATLGSNNWNASYQLGKNIIEVNVEDFIPNPVQKLVEDVGGKPTLKIVIGGASGREEYFLVEGDRKNIRGVNYNFSDVYFDNAVNFYRIEDQLFIRADRPLVQTVMATQVRDTLLPGPGTKHPLRLRSLYNSDNATFVIGDYHSKGKVIFSSGGQKMTNESKGGLEIVTKINDQEYKSFVTGQKGLPGRPSIVRADDLQLAISYGAKEVQVPFSIGLKEFIMDRYPGTNNAASYASEVVLFDPKEGVQMDYRIFMNNILNYKGFRFFQSSFDRDEKGTYLSVNFDFWGTTISYIGYFLLTLGLLMVFFDKNSRFRSVTRQIHKIRSKYGEATIIILLILCLPAGVMSQKVIPPQLPVIDAAHADHFGSVVVQDFRGRMKPVHTLSREVLRKVARKESLFGMNADQIILGMFAEKQSWLGIPIIKLGSHQRLKELIGNEDKLVAYRDFFEVSGQYKLRDEVRRVMSLDPIDRGTFEKELLKVDERVNIVSMIFSGRIFKIIPVPEDPNNLWVSGQHEHGSQQVHSDVAEKFFPAYRNALQEGIREGNYVLADQIINELKLFQEKEGAAIMPSATKIKAEILLNRLDVFGNLAIYYVVLGSVYLVLLFISVFKPSLSLKRLGALLFILVLSGFVFHTFGLGVRWYVSGRAPWSNGYETMIYIAWTATLAGLLFTKKSIGGMAATMILGGIILLVAMLSYLDPEITPLVPVLRSYWLTIHVSLIAGSYGFLMLGAIIGLVNLLLMIFIRDQNRQRVSGVVKELSLISEITLIGGLIMISIGTYLGGVWANESWGRYWGWDAKETWALVTILVYAFILHMRLIPGLKSLYAYNVMKLVGWASVIMTYFGVNYYLSGLHSYAAGDPVPIPTWVFIATISVIIISILAYLNKRKYAIF